MEGHCARHPEVPAVLTCERCGAFACSECVHDETALCVACVEAGHAGVPVPWEAPGGGGFWATMRAAWVTPRRLFGGLGRGDATRAYRFAVQSVLLYLLPGMVASAMVQAGGRSAGAYFLGGLCGAPFAAGIGVLFVCAVVAVVLRIAASVAGGARRFEFEDAFRLVAYSQAYVVALGPVAVLGVLAPGVGGVLGLVVLPLMMGLQVHALQAYFQGWQRLSAGAATLIALSPHGLLFGLCGSVFALAAYRQLLAAGALP